MKSLEFRKSIPRYVLLRLLRSRRLAPHLASLALRDLPPPPLPTANWLRIVPRMAGICGSDLATITAKGSPYLAPVTSMPFVMGHEVVGIVTEAGKDVRSVAVGDRVVIQPALGCAVRGISSPCEFCRDGREALCRNVSRGDISSGIQTGYCRDTGGGFSHGLIAHETQVFRVPAELDDRAAVLIEPFACAIHGALRSQPAPGQTALVIGCGGIGLLTIAALRATGCDARIVAVARYDHQRELARLFGATEIIGSPSSVKDRYTSWARTLDAEVLAPELGKPTVLGGADVTFDCVASSDTIDDGLRFTKSGGRFALVGMPGIPAGVDWTSMWFKELTVHAAYAYGPERRAGGTQPTFELAIELMRTWQDRLTKLVGPPFALDDYRAAFAAALNTGKSGFAKTVFAIDGSTP